MTVLAEAKKLGREYRHLTGKPLGVTGEVAEFEAARLLGLELSPPRQAGFDATESSGGLTRKLQIKGRCLLSNSKRGQRIGSIRVDKEFDAVLLVILNDDLDATAIYEAERGDVIQLLTHPGSKARNERGALSIDAFKKVARKRWPEQSGEAHSEIDRSFAHLANTTAPGYVNRNSQQVVRRTDLRGTDHGQYVYVLKCQKCGLSYGANGSDIFQRRCPYCQNGAQGLPYSDEVGD
jgi:hypothetical protein